jgi:hypothetical protein
MSGATHGYCRRHGIHEAGRCQQCASERTNTARQKARRAANNVALGRKSRHWMGLSNHARKIHPYCADCLATTDLTVDLIGGGDHRTATIDQVVVRCRSCHGQRDGGRRPLGGRSQAHGA